MTIYRSVEKIISGPPPHWVGDGFHVSNYMPGGVRSLDRLSPFFFLDYHAPYQYEPTENSRRGVGPHPHRGLETVSIAFAGVVAHHDSAGNSGVIYPGDVQWMTAGSGILHREYHEQEFALRGGTMHMAQLWVNLPKAHKMTAPKYQGITDSQIARVSLPDGAGFVRVIAGNYRGSAGAAATFSAMDLYDVRLEHHGAMRLEFSATANTGILVCQGSVTVNGEAKAVSGNLAVFANVAGIIEIKATAENTVLLVMSGEPLNEPVVAHGPFLMNSMDEIKAAYADFQSGKFGELED